MEKPWPENLSRVAGSCFWRIIWLISATLNMPSEKSPTLALSYLGKLTLNSIRTSDVAARYGGEELLVIAPNTSAASARTLAERLPLDVESHALVLTSKPSTRQEIRITVSIRVAGSSQEADRVQKLVHQADEAP